MDEVERSVYFYRVEVESGEWNRAAVLRGIRALTGDDRYLPLGNDNWAWALVDRVPTGAQTGRLRFFKDRRSNLPGVSRNGTITELNDGDGLSEGTHVVLAPNGIIAAEYNHYAPRIPTAFADFLRTRLDMDLRIETFVQGSILEQLERLDYITVFETTMRPTAGLAAVLADAGPIGDAVETLANASDGRRVSVKMTSGTENDNLTSNARRFARKMLPFIADGHGPTVLRVEGLDPVSGSEETLDLLRQRLVRVQDFERPTTRSKVLNTTSAYRHIEEALAQVRDTDLPNAALL
jgi:hypothetical protein